MTHSIRGPTMSQIDMIKIYTRITTFLIDAWPSTAG